MSDRVWRSGPPPHAGWWNASAYKNKNMWRWWNGEFWSVGAYDQDQCWIAGSLALKKSVFQKEVKWTDYYPENARVPRIDPRKA